jgi:hypothetical protein
MGLAELKPGRVTAPLREVWGTCMEPAVADLAGPALAPTCDIALCAAADMAACAAAAAALVFAGSSNAVT